MERRRRLAAGSGPRSARPRLDHSTAYITAVCPDPIQAAANICSRPHTHPLLLHAAPNPQVLDVLNRIGLSDSVLRLAERRQRLDKLLVYGGMLLTLLLVVGLYWWKKM